MSEPTEKQIECRVKFAWAAHNAYGKKGRVTVDGKLLTHAAVAVKRAFKED